MMAHEFQELIGEVVFAENIADNLRMKSGEKSYIWQSKDWPAWRYDLASLADGLTRVSRAQGMLAGRLADVGRDLRDQASLAALTDDVIKTSEIEGERLNFDSVRSSIARRLGMDIGALAPVDRHVDGLVDMVMDATGRCNARLTRQRLFAWHAALFPTGYSGLTPIRVGGWRADEAGPMQVVSGSHRRRRIHFEAPPAARLPAEMSRFVAWANAATSEPALIKAGIAHLWFVTLHPFDDGNGRMARAIGDLFLARAENSGQRFYSLSAQIQRDRSAYYDILERTQRGEMDVTEWLAWFLGTLQRALGNAGHALDRVLIKARFWQRFAGIALNPRQAKLLNRLLDGFDGNMTSSRWASIADCSPDTALRDINELIAQGILRKSDGGGRSTAYRILN